MCVCVYGLAVGMPGGYNSMATCFQVCYLSIGLHVVS